MTNSSTIANAIVWYSSEDVRPEGCAVTSSEGGPSAAAGREGKDELDGRTSLVFLLVVALLFHFCLLVYSWLVVAE